MQKIIINGLDLADNNPLRTQHSILLKPVHYSSTVLYLLFNLIFHFFCEICFSSSSTDICLFSFAHFLQSSTILPSFFSCFSSCELLLYNQRKRNKPEGPKQTEVTRKLQIPITLKRCFIMHSFIKWIHNLCSIKLTHRILSSDEEPK